jgi:hypothetical protein
MSTAAEGADPPLPSTFTTQTTQTRGGADWAPGFDLTLGYTWSADRALPQPIVRLDGEDISDQTILAVGEGDTLDVDIDLSSVAILVCARPKPLYLRAAAVVNAVGDAFGGRIESTCDSRTGSAPFLWTGKVTHPDHALGIQRLIAVLARSRQARS